MTKKMREKDYRQTLLRALYFRANRQPTVIAASDISGESLRYNQLSMRAVILSRKIAPLLEHQTNVGVLLPNALGAMVTFVSLQILGKVPCMLNYSAGPGPVTHACAVARVKTVLTSKIFVEKGKLEPLIEALSKDYKIVYLEDFRKKITIVDKIAGLVSSLLIQALPVYLLIKGNPDAPAVILYTSGSEGMPKGVALSHANILSNIAQAFARVDFHRSDIVFNALPVFHSFGLTVGMLMPLLRGMKIYFYPTPLHYKQIPAAVRESGATVMLGTDTFFTGYARFGTAEDFKNVRIAVAGAEKLREKTREEWLTKFSVGILQGYGVTETSPAIAFNTPDEHKPGTVGKAFPLIECKLEPVAGLEKGGRLLVKGPNVMLGYLKADQPGVIQPQGEWYDTGDIVDIGADGYITILGRAKRFAKIGGEMVSLVSVEELALAINAEVAHAAVTVPDERKGEQILLYTEDKNLTKDAIQKLAKEKGVAEIGLPRQVIFIEAIPRLGTGKIDYQGLTALAKKTPA